MAMNHLAFNSCKYLFAAALMLQIPLPTKAEPGSCNGLHMSRFIATRGPDRKLQVQERAVDPAMTPEELTCLSDQGHREAALELGRRYEDGNGVPVDLKQAERLYGKAAADVPAVVTLYRPPVNLGGSGAVFMLSNPNASFGLIEAKERLSRILLKKDR